MKRGIRIIALAVALLNSAIYAYALTLSSIEDHVRRNIRDTSSDTTLQRYSDTILDDLINAGQREVVDQTWCLNLSTSSTLVANTTYYSLPTDVLAVTEVTYRAADGTTSRLEETTPEKVWREHPDFEKSYTGTPNEYFVRTSTSGADSLEIAYMPIATTTSTGTVRVYYYSQANDMSSDSDVPFDGYRHLYPYHDTLWLYVTYRIKLLEGRETEADLYRTLFEEKTANMRSQLGRRPNYTPSVKAAPK